MKYISIDIESSGIIPEKCNVIQFGAVLDDLENPKPLEELPRYEVLLEWNEYKADSTWALWKHTALWERLEKAKGKKEDDPEREGIIKPWELGESFLFWLLQNKVIEKKGEPINVAGKNFARFDWNHLDEVPRFFDHIKFSQRVLDPGILYLKPNDRRVPNLEECLKRAGMEKEVSHTAVADALDVIKVIRKHFNINI